ncbi:hypothetical protein [Streptomyces antibioticus]|uniref:hypothetical protein n=1 Tax=Streptomyces antibioticus TaxID=1890 RepID=UPI0033A2FB5D
MDVRLCHSRPTDPGYGRKPHGRGFRDVDADGGTLRDRPELDRVRGLVIPPAWQDVWIWICTRANGHLKAVGTDAAGRRQYLYHPQFRAEQEQAKHGQGRQGDRPFRR